jgi:RNA polymerase sigma-70 factor (ECF subfamily)
MRASLVNLSDIIREAPFMPEYDFREIYEQYRPRLLHYLRGLLPEADAEDALQEAFEKIDRSLHSYRGEASLSTWIYRIATNTAYDRLRRKPVGTTGLDKLEPEQESAPSFEFQMIRSEMTGCIRAVINSLPENYRTVIALSDLEGFKDEEIADILNISLRAAKVRLHRARAKLRAELEKVCNFYRSEDNEFSCDLKNTFRDLRKQIK